MYSRNVSAMDTKTTPKMWTLTKYQWAVYYWLLANSKRNPSGQETHYFIYRNQFTMGAIRKQTGIKTDPTVRSALTKLIECGAIEPYNDGEAYTIMPPRLYIPMNASILIGLLGFHEYLDPGLAITTFAILARLDKFTTESEARPSFTKAELGILLGFAKQHVDDAGIILILYLLRGLGLIEFNTVAYNNKLGVACTRFILGKTYPLSKQFDSLLNADNTIDELNIKALWEKINQSCEK